MCIVARTQLPPCRSTPPFVPLVQPRQKSRAEHAAHLKEWLDVAQEELLNTQSQLQESEAECRRLSAALATARQGGADGQQVR